MKLTTLLLMALLCLPSVLLAQDSGWSVGIILGSPTGLLAKYELGRKSALAFNLGWSFIDPGFHATGDYQFLFPSVIETEEGEKINELTPYLGIGGRMLVHDGDGEGNGNNDIHVGVRLGGGIEWRVSRFGFFLELYPVVDIVPATEFDFEGGLGARFFL